MIRSSLIALIAAAALAGCGGGGSGGGTGGGSGSGGGGGGTPPPPPPPPPPSISKAEAYQFLNQATFGATEAEADRVIEMGIEAWIDEQLLEPASLQLPFLLDLPAPTFMFERQPDRADIWFRNALHGQDQLRQRVAFALSQIMVVSELGSLVDQPYGLASYYDTLATNAFGNYRDLIEDVTLHPAMGVYLSMLGNEKPDPVRNIRPDENYAREVMQLFSIGLVELNPDGSVRLDGNNEPIPTYDQAIIEGYAHVFTGWTYAGVGPFQGAFPILSRQITPMELRPEFHDTGEKRLLDGVVLPPGQSGEADLAAALDSIFQHDNVGPFIAIRLIQRLVTSNPSSRYVARVAAVFDDDGSGVRGNLGAVVKAILLDPEARPETRMDRDGKLKEPLLRLTQLWRSYGAASASGRYPYNFAYVIFGQGALQSPSVFNFFSPFYAPPGEIRNAGLVAPELEIATEYLNTRITNFMFCQAFFWTQEPDPDCGEITDETVLIDTSEEVALAGDPVALVDRVDEKLLAGEMSAMLRDEIIGMLERIPADQPGFRAGEAIYLAVTSPEFALQR